MKKLISCLLAVLLVCSLMSMSVFAAPVLDGTTLNNFVGTRGGLGNVNDGVNEDDFPGDLNNGSADVTVNFGQSTEDDGTTNPDTGNSGSSIIVHKYAVDITYGELLLDLTDLTLGDTDNDGEINEAEGEKAYFMVWDVNDHKYVLCTKNDDGSYTEVDESALDDPTVDTDNDQTPDTSIINTPYDVNGEVVITNHSDLSVYTTIAINNNAYGNITWDINDDGAALGATSHSETILKAEAGTNGGVGSATTGSHYTFTATPADSMSDGWLGVIGDLVNATNQTVIAQITVTIAKNA